MSQKIPQHVAIVMDGNGRWAENQGLERIEGHRAGLDVVRMVIKFCSHKKIPVLSLFAFSSENWSRPAAEVEFLMQIFLESLKREIPELHDKGICIRFMGDRSKLSDDICNKMYEAETLTINNNKGNILTQMIYKVALENVRRLVMRSLLNKRKTVVPSVQNLHTE